MRAALLLTLVLSSGCDCRQSQGVAKEPPAPLTHEPTLIVGAENPIIDWTVAVEDNAYVLFSEFDRTWFRVRRAGIPDRKLDDLFKRETSYGGAGDFVHGRVGASNLAVSSIFVGLNPERFPAHYEVLLSGHAMQRVASCEQVSIPHLGNASATGFLLALETDCTRTCTGAAPLIVMQRQSNDSSESLPPICMFNNDAKGWTRRAAVHPTRPYLAVLQWDGLHVFDLSAEDAPRLIARVEKPDLVEVRFLPTDGVRLLGVREDTAGHAKTFVEIIPGVYPDAEVRPSPLNETFSEISYMRGTGDGFIVVGFGRDAATESPSWQIARTDPDFSFEWMTYLEWRTPSPPQVFLMPDGVGVAYEEPMNLEAGERRVAIWAKRLR